MSSKSRTRLLVASMALGCLAGGCDGTIHKKGTLGDLETLSIDARQRLVLAGQYHNETHSGRAVCTEPSPDAIVARAAALAAGANATFPVPAGATGTSALAGALAASSTETAASIGVRSQTIQLMRDAYFRACEGLLNGVIDQDAYRVILANSDSVTVALAAVDALGGTTVAPNVAIAAGPANASVTPGGPVVASAGTAVQAQIAGGAVGSGATQQAQANAIKEIALAVIRHANSREKVILRERQLRARREAVALPPS